LLVRNIFKNSISSSDKSFSSVGGSVWVVDYLKILSCSSLERSFQSLSTVSLLSPSNLIFVGSFIPFSFNNVVIISSSSAAGGGVAPPGWGVLLFGLSNGFSSLAGGVSGGVYSLTGGSCNCSSS
jgi:hypothetical protein